MLNRMKQEGISALSNIDGSYISSEEKFAHFRPRPRSADVTAAQIWKILHIVAAIAVAVLTREREISTCPLHIPARALNNTRLPSEPRAKRLRQPVRSAQDLVKRSECEMPETGDSRAATLSRPNERQHEVFLEFEMSLLNHLTQKLQKGDAP